MANAMLEEDYKSSHQDLTTFASVDEDEPKMNHHHHEEKNHRPVNDHRKPAAAASLPTRKSVDFAILPPAKRSKPNNHHRASWTAKQVVDAVSTSITPNERLEAVRRAKDCFHHDSETRHNEEMATGADAVMAKHLTFLVYHARHLRGRGFTRPELESMMAEVGLTCEALESLYRASSPIVGASFVRMGNELMNLLVTIMDDEISRRLLHHQSSVATAAAAAAAQRKKASSSPPPPPSASAADEGKAEETDSGEDAQSKVKKEKDDDDDDGGEGEDEEEQKRRGSSQIPPLAAERSQKAVLANAGTAEGDLLLRKATKILGHFARVGEATKPLAHFPGLLGCLVNLITLRPYECAPWEARLSALWIIANLACNADNMQMMVCTPGLVNALVEVACRPLHPGDSLEMTMEVLRSRSIASRAILNLSWAPENKVTLAEHAALIDLLTELSVHRSAPMNRSRTVRDILATTRRHAAGALRNLAAAPRRVKIGLCGYRNGHVLDTLTDAALNDPDTAVKDRAFAAIHNLAIQDTAEKIVSHPALVLALKDVLLSDAEDGDSTKQHASATLLVLERSITEQMSSYENLRDLLDAVNPTATSDDNETEEKGATAEV